MNTFNRYAVPTSKSGFAETSKEKLLCIQLSMGLACIAEAFIVHTCDYRTIVKWVVKVDLLPERLFFVIVYRMIALCLTLKS